MKDHAYIKLIEFSLEREGENFSMQEAMEATGLQVPELERAHQTLFVLPDRLPSHRDGYRRGTGEDTKREMRQEKLRWVLSPQAFFGYISHRQHQDANANALITHWMVGLSIFVSILALGVSVAILLVNLLGS
jgi:hypothetical protein